LRVYNELLLDQGKCTEAWLTIFKPFHLQRGDLGRFSKLLISKIVQNLDLPELW
jgi:hypothetical protein